MTSKTYVASVLLLTALFTTGCSSIDKKDCQSDMTEMGLKHGRMGSPKKFTDQLRSICSGGGHVIDLEKYEKSFHLGWGDYCTPSNALSLGKTSDPYVSFCPAQKEAIFREKYLIGKRINELKDIEDELMDEITELREDALNGEVPPDEVKKLEKDLIDLRKNRAELEINGMKDSLTLINHL